MSDRDSRTTPPISPLIGVRFASFWIDESGSKATASHCFVMAGIKVRHADDLQRAVHGVRQATEHTQELKFGKLNRYSYDTYARVVDVLEASEAKLCATVVEKGVGNPFHGRAVWKAHTDLIAGLVLGNLNRGEVASVHLDGITTPPGQSMGTAVRRTINKRVHSRVITEAVSLNSKSNDLLQIADLIAGAISFERRRLADEPSAVNEYKLKISRRLPRPSVPQTSETSTVPA